MDKLISINNNNFSFKGLKDNLKHRSSKTLIFFEWNLFLLLSNICSMHKTSFFVCQGPPRNSMNRATTDTHQNINTIVRCLMRHYHLCIHVFLLYNYSMKVRIKYIFGSLCT